MLLNFPDVLIVEQKHGFSVENAVGSSAVTKEPPMVSVHPVEMKAAQKSLTTLILAAERYSTKNNTNQIKYNMAELSNGMHVKLRNGGTCTVKKELGRGGQGIVYLVDYNGKDYALKWYIVQYPDSFYENLERNISKGSPTPSFLWPEALTERQNGSFGYLMKVRPSGYEEIGSFMLTKAKFASVDALLEACLQICTGFQQLHLNGYSYQDMNDGNFFINPKTGDVLICDNDNVAPNGINMGIVGKSGYMAPEIVDKVSMPNRFT